MMPLNYRLSAGARRAHPWLLLPFGIAAVLSPATAVAYSYGTVGSDPCHEDIAAGALRQIRIELPAVGPIPVTWDEKALVDDLPFDVASVMQDAAGATLLAAAERGSAIRSTASPSGFTSARSTLKAFRSSCPLNCLSRRPVVSGGA